MKIRWVAIIATISILCGCKAVYEGKYDFDAGWRKAIFIKHDKPTDPDLKLGVDCRKKNVNHGEMHYVTARYMFLNRYCWYGVFVAPKHADFIPGEIIYVNINDCNLPVAKQNLHAPAPATPADPLCEIEAFPNDKPSNDDMGK